VRTQFMLIAGTNRDLRQQVQLGRFREDLLARIDLWTFTLPGLRDRPEDLEPNLDFELAQFSARTGQRVTINSAARQRWLDFATSPDALWIGNFRDLHASVVRMATLATSGRITVDDVSEEIDRLQSNWRGNARPTGISAGGISGAPEIRAANNIRQFPENSASNISSDSVLEINSPEYSSTTRLAPPPDGHFQGGSTPQLTTPDPDLVTRTLGPESAAALDRFDRVQLEDVLRVCAQCTTISQAGRTLFAQSMGQRQTRNDADRLRKYLARFGLRFEGVAGQHRPQT
jgi:transcriptional regulatory protein RtcR